MTREELKAHCERQIQQFERDEKIMPVTLNDWKRYEEHNLILELLEQQSCEDCISREDAINKIEEWADGFEEGSYFSGKSVADAIRACGGIIAELPSVTPKAESEAEK